MSIQIRPAVPADAPALLAIYAPYVAQTAITFEYDVPTETEFACRIADTLKKCPLIGLFCHAGRAEAIWKTAKSTALIKRNTATTI